VEEVQPLSGLAFRVELEEATQVRLGAIDR
jgi:hypothetical protein